MTTPSIRFEQTAEQWMAVCSEYRISINLTSGLTSYEWSSGARITDAYSTARLGTTELRSTEYPVHRMDPKGIEAISDKLGTGFRFTVIHESELLPVLKQTYWLYEQAAYFFLQVCLESEADIETNYISPLTAGVGQLPALSLGGSEEEIRAVLVPFDNDKWVRYESVAMPGSLESYEVTALYEAAARSGVVIGSVTHDTWKTGIKISGDTSKSVHCLEVYGGAAGEYTRDSLPHGSLIGRMISSPRIFIGAYQDYRQGMEQFGQVNACIEPPLPWDEGVPFGWNSWSAAGVHLDYDLYVHTSDFLKSLQDGGFEQNGTVYINFDSFWTNLTEQQLQDAVSCVRANGQKPGIYWTPFAFWGKDLDRAVEGTDGKFTYRDILLYDSAGRLLPELDGGLAIDPSHPGNLQRTEWHLDRFVKWGFEYIKLDFLGHGALEGVHADERIRTGLQAYNLGMEAIRKRLDPKLIGRPFFINLSIAPIFPHQYAHSRRISCDAFGMLKDTEYMLNSLTHGWWMNGTIYPYNDPDHTVLYKSYNQEATELHEGRSRLNASIIAGTVLLMGDDFRREEAAARAREWLTKREIIDIARSGKSFIPVDAADAADGAADVFFHFEDNGDCHIAVFNYSNEEEAVKTVHLARMGIVKTENAYTVKDIWKEQSTVSMGDLQIRLEPGESKILRLTWAANA